MLTGVLELLQLINASPFCLVWKKKVIRKVVQPSSCLQVRELQQVTSVVYDLLSLLPSDHCPLHICALSLFFSPAVLFKTCLLLNHTHLHSKSKKKKILCVALQHIGGCRCELLQQWNIWRRYMTVLSSVFPELKLCIYYKVNMNIFIRSRLLLHKT